MVCFQPRRIALVLPLLCAFVAPAAAADSAPAAPKQCDDAVKAGITLAGGLDTKTVCSELVADWGTRPTTSPAPRRFELSTQNDQFTAALRASVKQYRNKTPVVPILISLEGVQSHPTLVDLRTAHAPDYKEAELGIWLDRIADHNGVVTRTDQQGLALLPLAFEWVGRPLIRFLISQFPKDPYKYAKNLDAIIVTYGSGANAGSLKRVCLVPKGHTGDKDICEDTWK